MSNISIITDSTTDLQDSWLEENDVKCIKLTYLIDDEEFYDDANPEAVKEFYDKLRAGKMSKTSAISVEHFKEVFEEELKKGKDVFYTGLSGGLSGTCNNAFMAMEELNKEYSDNQVYVTDSISVSYIVVEFIKKAVEMRKLGKSAQEIVDAIDGIKHNYFGIASVDDLMHLKRGGRVSGAAATVGTILNIKPVVFFDESGKLELRDKVKGNKKLFKYFLGKIADFAEDPVNQPIYVVSSDARESSLELKAAIEKEFGSKNVQIETIGSIVGTHLGPNSLIIAFKAKCTREVLSK